MAKWTNKPKDKPKATVEGLNAIIEAQNVADAEAFLAPPASEPAPLKAEPIAAQAPEPAPAPKPAPVYTMGYNPEKMRLSCGKCKGTQLLITQTFFKEGPGGPDGKPTQVKDGHEFTCNDCKTKYRGK